VKGSDVSIGKVSKFFGDFRALKGVSLEIKGGEFFSLLGPSGCGKTTLLRIIAGFEQPDEGSVTIDGINVLPLPPNRRHANTVFQNYALFPHLSVFENVAFPLRLKNTKNSIVTAKVNDYLHLVELGDHAAKMPSMLSGGQKQRVAIARALINEPSVLLLDEPLSALDAKLRHHMLMELDAIHDKIGITFIYVTHDQSEALSVSDRIAVMYQGDVLQVGTPHDIYESPATNFVAQFIGETNMFEGTVRASMGQMYVLDVDELGRVVVTDDRIYEVGERVSLTVRPEKLRISPDEPRVNGRSDINVFEGTVDEPIYSGFQSKYYVRLSPTVVFRVFKQHSDYTDEEHDILWKERVHVSWSAKDGYIVEGHRN
jgi:spermidine/putrescine transport system ATP-binding protein